MALLEVAGLENATSNNFTFLFNPIDDENNESKIGTVFVLGCP